jgi:phosphate transport system permease protein
VNSNTQVATYTPAAAIRPAALRRHNVWDAIFRGATGAAGVLVLLMLGAVIAALIHGSVPSFKKFGFAFVISDVWNPNPEVDKYGAFPAIYGTVVTSVIAMLIGIPVSLGIATFITELCPVWLKRPISTAIELLAGIPSIIYGIWGFFVLAPFLQDHVQPLLIAVFGHVPLLSTLFSGPPYRMGVFTAGVILSLMVLPYITSVTRDVFETVPAVLKESAYGLGCTTWEVVRNIMLPYTRVGVIGGVMLGLGRALGETMAVTFVIGNAQRVASSILAPGATISATIANEFAEAETDLYTSALIELGLILFVITFLVLAAARLLLARAELAGRT